MPDPIAAPGTLTLLSPLTPPLLARAWLTAAHPTLPLAATCSADKTVRVYSLTSFTLLSTIAGGHKRSVRSVAWKPGVQGGAVLATGSFDASVGVWRKEDEGLEGAGEGLTDFTGGAGVGDEQEEEEEWRFALVLDGHDSEVKSVAWSAGGNLLATCSRDKSVWVWEEVSDEDFETVAVLQEHGGDVKFVAWHPEEELLASASYDEEVRLWREDGDDWGCVACLKGHEGTVWAVEWEGLKVGGPDMEIVQGATVEGSKQEWIKRREAGGPRLLSCSDDLSVKVWRRRPRDRQEQSKYSIIRTGNNEEDWVEEATLPRRHSRAVYSVAWSKMTGMIVSTGGDGKIVVYNERWKKEDGQAKPSRNSNQPVNGVEASKVTQDGVAAEGSLENSIDNTKGLEDITTPEVSVAATEWMVVAEIEGAHGVFEINHVCWAKRADRGKRRDDEEVILSTGDDGLVKVWTLDV